MTWNPDGDGADEMPKSSKSLVTSTWICLLRIADVKKLTKIPAVTYTKVMHFGDVP